MPCWAHVLSCTLWVIFPLRLSGLSEVWPLADQEAVTLKHCLLGSEPLECWPSGVTVLQGPIGGRTGCVQLTLLMP